MLLFFTCFARRTRPPAGVAVGYALCYAYFDGEHAEPHRIVFTGHTDGLTAATRQNDINLIRRNIIGYVRMICRDVLCMTKHLIHVHPDGGHGHGT